MLLSQADPAAAATVGKLVISFTGDDLDMKMRMERSRRLLPIGLSSAQPILELVNDFDLVKATGSWNMASIFVQFKNFFAHTLPPWPEAVYAHETIPTSPSDKAESQKTDRPIASAVMVTIQSGEALEDLGMVAEPSSPIAVRMNGKSVSIRRSSDVDRLIFFLNTPNTCCFLVEAGLLSVFDSLSGF